MNPTDFSIFVLPLGILVFVLVAGILFIVKKEEIAKDKKIRRIDSILKEKNKKRELAEKQLNELQGMLGKESIDADTYGRLMTLIKMHEESEEETQTLLEQIWDD